MKTDIEQVRQANDIVEVISRNVELQKKGRELVGLCPFHPDHNPSMYVNPEKQIFKCFVCGAGGDVFKYIQLREKLSFPASVAYFGKPTQETTRIRKPQARPAEVVNWGAVQARYTLKPNLGHSAKELGVSEKSLFRLGCGWDGVNMTFPMCDAFHSIIGIRLRGPEGKLCVRGSKTGIFWPNGVKSCEGQLLFITEGPTDCAAMLSMGFDAIGRPSCCGGAEIIRECLSRSKREVVVMADNDPPKSRPNGSAWFPGWEGAVRLAAQIKGLCTSVRIIKPPDHKDIRAWYNAGATAEAVMALVKSQRRIVA